MPRAGAAQTGHLTALGWPISRAQRVGRQRTLCCRCDATRILVEMDDRQDIDLIDLGPSPPTALTRCVK